MPERSLSEKTSFLLPETGLGDAQLCSGEYFSEGKSSTGTRRSEAPGQEAQGSLSAGGALGLCRDRAELAPEPSEEGGTHSVVREIESFPLRLPSCANWKTKLKDQ